MSSMQVKHQNSNSDIKNQIPLLEKSDINKSLRDSKKKNSNEFKDFNKQF